MSGKHGSEAFTLRGEHFPLEHGGSSDNVPGEVRSGPAGVLSAGEAMYEAVDSGVRPGGQRSRPGHSADAA